RRAERRDQRGLAADLRHGSAVPEDGARLGDVDRAVRDHHGLHDLPDEGREGRRHDLRLMARAVASTVPRRAAGQQSVGRVARALGFYAGLSLGALVMALPMIWMVTTSFKAESVVFAVPIQWLPVPFRP